MSSPGWSIRDVLAAVLVVVCFAFAWLISLGPNLFVYHYPDREYALEQLAKNKNGGPLGDSFLADESATYWGPRWMWFGPHVFSAILWWNLSWVQLIKWIRAKHLWIHRWNGRLQATCMLGQIITGIGLATGSPTPGIKMLSIAYGLAMAYVLAQTIYYVRKKDIVRHKYWATKLFGYSQAIALQRIYLVAFVVLTLADDENSPYNAITPSSTLAQRNAESKEIFNDSFTMCIFTAIVLTEWYQAADHDELLEYRAKEAKMKLPLEQPLVR
ncbi:unnamed protein product [Symbiodinium natans]|uniref:Uncharacterized protein n=1 Tax=Symbiodinium natans TaxID=878477 RepID=A0A812S8X6_9DINO|nr:unnamed protein product [Symbiodinium natans]